jgi:hypothetical protein
MQLIINKPVLEYFTSGNSRQVINFIIFPIISWLEKVSKSSLTVFKLDAKLIIKLGYWSGFFGGGAVA